MHTLFLQAPRKSQARTPIHLCASLEEGMAALGSLASFDAVVLLYDRNVEDIAKRVLHVIPSTLTVPVSSGEDSKALSEVERIASRMLELGCTKNTLLIACGGGMVTDLGGFVGSVFMRGIRTVLLPTTLLGMVDAAIGGKNGVNCAGHKNMIGTISHPSAVLIDLSLLRTLPDPQYADGMAEIIKIAAIADAPFFTWMEASLAGLLAREEGIVAECVERAIQAKIRIVEQDDADEDRRLWLNFGHTIGHAVEALSRYQLSHGQAISIGMIAELRSMSSALEKRVSALLQAFKLPVILPSPLSEEALFDLMSSDKKALHGDVRIAVPRAIGEGSVLVLRRDQFHSLFP